MLLRRFVLRTLPLALALLCVSALTTAHAAVPAAEGMVTTCTLDGFNTVYNAVYDAGGGTVVFQCSGIITFTSQKFVQKSIMIDGGGYDVTLSGGNATRLFLVTAPGMLQLRHLTVRSGNGTSSGAPGAGGAITVSTGLLVLSNVTLHANEAPNGGGGAVFLNTGARVEIVDSVLHHNESLGGGAIYNNTGGTLEITGSQFYSNSTQGPLGGAIQNLGVMTATATSFTGNTALVDFGVGREGGGALFNDAGGTANLRFVTMTANQAHDSGGAVWNRGSLLIEGGIFTSNRAGLKGGAIANEGGAMLLTIEGARFAQNRARDGGALYAAAPVTIRDTDFDGNGVAAIGYGGAIYLDDSADGTLLERVTLRNNRALDGGGLYTLSPSLTLRNSTISENHASGTGGGIRLGISQLSVRNSTVAGNSAGASSGGVHIAATYDSEIGTTVFDALNSIVAGNTPLDCHVVQSGPESWTPIAAYSIAGDASCAFTGLGAQNSTNPLLGPLANNGGFTLTHLPAATSPAVDTGTNADCPSPDQRGSMRPIGAACDVGAVEYNPALLPTATPTPTNTPTPTLTPTHTPMRTPVAVWTEVFLPAVQK